MTEFKCLSNFFFFYAHENSVFIYSFIFSIFILFYIFYIWLFILVLFIYLLAHYLCTCLLYFHYLNIETFVTLCSYIHVNGIYGKRYFYQRILGINNKSDQIGSSYVINLSIFIYFLPFAAFIDWRVKGRHEILTTALTITLPVWELT